MAFLNNLQATLAALSISVEIACRSTRANSCSISISCNVRCNYFTVGIDMIHAILDTQHVTTAETKGDAKVTGA